MLRMRAFLLVSLTVGSLALAVEAPVFDPYGFLLPAISVSSGAVESFSQPNLSAYTAAANPVLAAVPGQARSAFHLGQSRVGVVVRPAPSTSGLVGAALEAASFWARAAEGCPGKDRSTCAAAAGAGSL